MCGPLQMLEFYEDEEAALQVLENYAYNKEFPLNPNAHVYLYQFLKRHQAPQAKLISSLRVWNHSVSQEYMKVLIKMTPMLCLCHSDSALFSPESWADAGALLAPAANQYVWTLDFRRIFSSLQCSYKNQPVTKKYKAKAFDLNEFLLLFQSKERSRRSSRRFHGPSGVFQLEMWHEGLEVSSEYNEETQK